MSDERLHLLEIRRSELRHLLRRLVKYVREDKAVTPGKTRLARLVEQVDDYLNRTSEPSDILRTDTPPRPAPPLEAIATLHAVLDPPTWGPDQPSLSSARRALAAIESWAREVGR